MQHAKQLTPFHRHAENLDLFGVLRANFAIKISIGFHAGLANQTAAGAMKIDIDADIQLRILLFGLIQGPQYFFTSFVGLQI